MRLIFCVACWSLAMLDCRAQGPDRVTLRKFRAGMDSLYNTSPPGSCREAIGAYMSSLKDIQHLIPGLAFAGFHNKNAAFNNKQGAACTMAGRLIKQADSLVRAGEAGGDLPAILSLLYELTYLQRKAAGYLAVDLSFTGKHQVPVTPSVKIQGVEAGFNNKYNTGEPYTIYVDSGASYEISATLPGYRDTVISLKNCRSDLAFSIELESLEPVSNDEGVGPSNVNPVKKAGSNSFLWISAFLALAVLFLLSRLLSLRSRMRAIQTAPATDEGSDGPVGTVRSSRPDVLPLSSSPSKYFLSELMMTAGPRKKPADHASADRDLGEDVCGFVMHGEMVLMWVLDGASDYYSMRNPETGREYFSSRLLAQSIAAKLKLQLAAIEAGSFPDIINSIIAEVRSDWLRTIAALPESEKTLLKRNIGEGTSPDCAATLLIAKLGLAGDLLVYRSGDCKMFIYQTDTDSLRHVPTSLTGKNSASNDWLFFRMVMTGDNLDIVHNTPLFEVVTMEQVDIVVGVSDGIGGGTLSRLSSERQDNAESLRSILAQETQGTGDDKAVCMIEIKV